MCTGSPDLRAIYDPAVRCSLGFGGDRSEIGSTIRFAHPNRKAKFAPTNGGQEPFTLLLGSKFKNHISCLAIRYPMVAYRRAPSSISSTTMKRSTAVRSEPPHSFGRAIPTHPLAAILRRSLCLFAPPFRDTVRVNRAVTLRQETLVPLVGDAAPLRSILLG